MDKCVQMLDKKLWHLGPDGPGVRREESHGGREPGESAKERDLDLMDGDWSGKKGKTINAGGVGELD
ncbi:hypothetical protein TNCV_2190761 [Trichonephila clavipes]|uniref:Uncharacterized protein n=1 Tax=Trichonephila clavipes TaxID=2585209 RepID=A0A8X6R456_TRICX|nr:hypothetical protein TNCV_2190761 [Trichonephila clavipes]